MNPQTKYLLVSSAFLTLSYFVYLIVFRKERNFKQRRFYLLAGVLFSFAIPFANIYIKLPAPTQAQKQVLEKPVNYNFQKPQNYTQNLTPAFVPETETQHVPVQKNINWWQLIVYLYFAVSAVLILRILIQILILQIRVWQSTVFNKSNYKLVVNNHYKSSFSFFNWIFIHSETKQDADLEKIISHECVHVREKHSVDTILFELVCAIMWFNPFVWFMRNSIQLVHEFLADEGALKTGINQLQYQALMINQVAEADVITLTSHFNSSTLKKRINMIINGEKYKKTKFRILSILPVSLLLLIIIAFVNGLNEQKVMERKMRKNETISKTFNRGEIADLAKIRVLVDNMIQKQTGESDIKLAYEKYISYLGESKTTEDVANKILLPHDSLIQVIQENITFQEVWKTGGDSEYTNVALNREGKIMEFINQLSKENPHYLNVLQGIEIAGDISPANIADFIKVPENYNWESEAEKLYASVLLVILTNKTSGKNEIPKEEKQNKTPNYLIPAKVDTTRLRNAFIKYQENPTEIHALAVYNVLPEKGHPKLEETGRKIIGEIGNNLTTLEQQVLQGKRNSVKLAFRLFTISDGAFTEWLQIILGQLIQVNPELFLQELKIHQHLCHELPILNFGPKFVDKFDEQSKEAERRIKALQTVNSPDLIKLRDWCIGELQYKQERVKSILSLTIVDEWDYSPLFVNEMKDLLDFNTKMILDSNKITTNRDEIYYFPDYIPLNFPTELRGKNDKMEIQLFINRINQSSIVYRFQYKKDNVVSEWISGEAHLLAGFFFGDEMDKDERTGEIYSSQQFIDRNTDTNIRIGKGENKGLRAKIDDRNILIGNCPVLSSELKNLRPIDDNLPKNDIIRIGHLKDINVQQLFALLKITDLKSPRKFIVYGVEDELDGDKQRLNVKEWLTFDDIKFLISKLESVEECKCLMNYYSSIMPFKERATIGGFAALFLDAYQKDVEIPYSLTIAPTNNKSLETELKDWWKESQKLSGIEITQLGYLTNIKVQNLFELLKITDPDSQNTFSTFDALDTKNGTDIFYDIRKWLSYEDLSFLMSMLESEEECKCLLSNVSSYLPYGAKATFGGLAAMFLESYKTGYKFYPNGYAAPQVNHQKVKELNEWWSSYKINPTLESPSFGGTYEFGDAKKGEATGRIQIHPISDTLLLFHLEVNRGKPSFNSGEINGELIANNKNNGTFHFKTETNSYFNCELRFFFRNSSVQIKSIESECGFGYGVTADGIYNKSSDKIPQSWYDRSGNEHKFLPSLQKTNRQLKIGDIDIIITQTKNNNYELNTDFVCRGTIQTFKNNIPVDSLKFNDMEAVGDRYGLNFSSQPIPDLIIGLKFGDYNGRLIIIPETGKIENYPGGPFFIPKNKNLIVSPWHSDLSGITIYDVEKKKVVMQKEVPRQYSDLYYFQDEYYSARWENDEGINAIYKLDLEKFELVKSEKTLAEIKTGEKVEYYDSDCDCN